MKRRYEQADVGDEETSSSKSPLFAPFDSLLSGLRSLLSQSPSRAADNVYSDSRDTSVTRSTDTEFGCGDYTELDTELLDAKRRIVQLLATEDGYLQQSELVARTRWSASTISRKLCDMESSGRIARYELGAGKVVIDTHRADISDIRSED